jgi:hypothetical protein
LQRMLQEDCEEVDPNVGNICCYFQLDPSNQRMEGVKETEGAQVVHSLFGIIKIKMFRVKGAKKFGRISMHSSIHWSRVLFGIFSSSSSRSLFIFSFRSHIPFHLSE